MSLLLQLDWDRQLTELTNRLPQSDLIVLDVETSGLDSRRDKILSVILQLGANPVTDIYYLPIGHEIFTGTAPSARFNAAVVDLLQGTAQRTDFSRKVIGHNLIFDLLFMYSLGVIWPSATSFHCTMTAQSLIDEWQSSYKLGDCATAMNVVAKKGDILDQELGKFFGIENPEKLPRAKKLITRLAEVPGDFMPLVEYATGDVHTTWELWHAQQPEIDAQGLRRVYDVEVKATRALFWMQAHGIKVDEEKIDAAILGTTDTRNQALEALAQIPDGKGGLRACRPSAAKDVHAYLKQADFDFSSCPKTKKGGIQLDRHVLATSDAGQQLLAVKKPEKLLGSFLLPLKNTHVFDGRVFPRYMQARSDDGGTVSGRLSSGDPNFQQIPARDPVSSALLRNCFIPDVGMVWSDSDQSQAEFRIFSHYAGDKELIEGYKQNLDMHSVVAKAQSIGRHEAKTLNFSVLYGAGIAKVASQLGITMEEAELLRNQYFRQFPSIPAFIKAARERAKERGYVMTYLGRRVRFPLGKGRLGNDGMPRYYKAANGIIQGTNADMLKVKLGEMSELAESVGFDVYRLLGTVHDSVQAQFAEGPEGEKAHQESLRIFANENDSIIKFSVPMPIVTGIGKTWAEASSKG